MQLDLSHCSDEAIRFTGLDDCIIGVDHRGFIVYSYSKMLAHFSQNMTTYEANEYIQFNVVGIKPDNYTVVYHEY